MKCLPVPFQGPMTNQAPFLVPVVVVIGESFDGFLVFSVLDVVDFDVVCGCFLDDDLGGGERERFWWCSGKTCR